MAAARLARTTLDIAERQVLVAYWDDASDIFWHQRVLLAPTPAAGRWICVTPDWEVLTLDQNALQVVPLPRKAPFPPG